MMLNISDIQHFSTGDGPGIRTTVFFKGCGMRCPWCHNPETQSPQPEILHYASGDHRCGKMMSVEETAAEVLEDLPFYKESSGGATLSGG